jgi:Ca-activated chloride channel family protein
VNPLHWRYQHPELIHLVWIALAITGGLVALELRGRGQLSTFLSPVMQRRLTARASTERTVARLALVLVCLLAGVVALMRPQEPGSTQTITSEAPTADVMFVLDVSRSMLADDASPTRLARAKAEIGQLVSRLENQRVGLIAFAGRAVEVCPLTPDHAFFDTVLQGVDTNSARKGGTRVGDAIKVALRGFPAGDGAKLIVLITDGDDAEKAEDTVAAAKTAAAAGVKIIAVGLGSETGSTITLVDPKTGAKSVLTYEGKPVISKLDGDMLRKVALTTEGAYIPAGTSAIDLDSIMESHVRPLEREAEAKATREIPDDRFQWPALISLIALIGALWLGSSAGDRRRS